MTMELTHKQAVNRLKDIEDELERLSGKDALTEEDETYWSGLVRESAEVDDHRKGLERAAELERVRLRAAANRSGSNGEIRVEPGADKVEDKILEPDSVKDRRFKDPYDLSEIRMGLTPEQRSAELRARAISAIEGMPASDDHRRETMTRFIERFDSKDARISQLALAASSEAYLRAFGKLLGNQGSQHVLDPDESEAVARAMSLTDSAGGFLIPFQLDPNVINTADGSFNQVRQASREVIATGDVWNGVASAGVTGRWAAEGSESGDNAPTLSQPSVTVHKLDIFVPISIEAIADAQNVAQEVAEMIAFEKDRLESVAFVNGSGSGQPFGIVTALDAATASEVSTATADAFALGDLYALDESLPARYRARASWLANRAIYNDVRQFDSSGGAALWERLGADVPPQLLGRPAFEAEEMESNPAATVGADNDSILVFGDFQNYVIADRLGTTVEFVPHLLGANGRPTGERGWYAYARVGADSVNDGAFRLLQS